MKRYWGVTATMLSALIYGITPAIMKMTYAEGVSSLTATFLRAALALPLLLVIMLARHIPVRLGRRQTRDMAMVGFLGAVTSILLYGSYSYISVGLATTLHFTYPVFVTLGGVFFFKHKIGRPVMIALGLGVAGVVLYLEGASARGVLGIAMALTSGATFAAYMLGAENTTVGQLHFFTFAFYVCVCNSLLSLPLAAATGTLTLNLSPRVWLITLAVSVLGSVVATPLLKQGIALTGATTAAILSIFEPISSVVTGALVLGESMTPLKIAGSLLILSGIVIVLRQEARKASEAAPEPEPEPERDPLP